MTWIFIVATLSGLKTCHHQARFYEMCSGLLRNYCGVLKKVFRNQCGYISFVCDRCDYTCDPSCETKGCGFRLCASWRHWVNSWPTFWDSAVTSSFKGPIGQEDIQLSRCFKEKKLIERDVSYRDWKWTAVSAWLSHAIVSPALHRRTGMVTDSQ